MLIRRLLTLVLSLVAVIGIAAASAGTASAGTRHNTPPPAAFTRYHAPSSGTIA
jgi:hypothetical protein